MVRSTELLHYSMRLAEMAVNKEVLRQRLITQTADLQDFESNLFKLCVLDFAEECTFLKERSKLLAKISDESYCDSVYSVVSKGVITFFDENDVPLVKLVTQRYTDDDECEIY